VAANVVVSLLGLNEIQKLKQVRFVSECTVLYVTVLYSLVKLQHAITFTFYLVLFQHPKPR